MNEEWSQLGLTVELSSEVKPSLNQIPEFMSLGARLVETEAGWNGVSEVWEVPYAGDSKGRSFELYAILSGIPGPYVCYSAGSHGNEMTSVSVGRRLGEELRQQIARGTLIIIPRANVPAVDQGKRVARGQNEGDMNRHYGDEPGSSLIKDRAHTVLRVIQDTYKYAQQTYEPVTPSEIPGVVIDGHTEHTPGNYTIIPYARIDRMTDDTTLAHSIRAALVMGIIPVMEYHEKDLKKEGLTSALSYVLAEKRVPTVTLELGPAGAVDEHYVRLGVTMIHNLLGFFQMRARDVEEGTWIHASELPELPPTPPIGGGQPVRLDDIYCIDSDGKRLKATSGLLELTIRPGDFIPGGAQIGTLADFASLNQRIPVFGPHTPHWPLSLYPITTTPKESSWYMGAVLEEDPRIIGIYQREIALIKEISKPLLPV